MKKIQLPKNSKRRERNSIRIAKMFFLGGLFGYVCNDDLYSGLKSRDCVYR